MFSQPLSIHPAAHTVHPIQGILIRGASPAVWLQALSQLGLDPEHTPCYPVPDLHPGQLWGAVLWLSAPVSTVEPPHQALQQVHNCLLLPERTTLHPALGSAALQDLLLCKRHFWHPQLGLVELFEAVDWLALLALPTPISATVITPEPGIQIAQEIYCLMAHIQPPEDGLSLLDEAALDEPHISERPPLTPLEKRRLEQLTRWRNAQKQSPPTNLIRRFFQRAFPTSPWTPALEEEYDALQQRTAPSSDDLVDLLKKDPNKGLSYAPPLNENGAGRGGQPTTNIPHGWNWKQHWDSTSLHQTGNRGNRNSGRHQSNYVSESAYDRLRRQYLETAAVFAEQGQYDKAAFVYLRLLRDVNKALTMLEKGKLYAQALSVCLQYTNDKRRAARYALQAQQLERALQLYQELDDPLEMGLLYEAMNQPDLAREQYERVLAELIDQQKFIDAGQFAYATLHDVERAKDLYLLGWEYSLKAEACLRRYLNLHTEEEAVKQAIERIYTQDITSKHADTFLRLLRSYHKEKRLPSTWLEEMAYRIVADHIQQKPSLLDYLLYFQRGDAQIVKDVLRYHRQVRKKRKGL